MLSHDSLPQTLSEILSPSLFSLPFFFTSISGNILSYLSVIDSSVYSIISPTLSSYYLFSSLYSLYHTSLIRILTYPIISSHHSPLFLIFLPFIPFNAFLSFSSHTSYYPLFVFLSSSPFFILNSLHRLSYISALLTPESLHSSHLFFLPK